VSVYTARLSQQSIGEIVGAIDRRDRLRRLIAVTIVRCNRPLTLRELTDQILYSLRASDGSLNPLLLSDNSHTGQIIHSLHASRAAGGSTCDIAAHR